MGDTERLKEIADSILEERSKEAAELLKLAAEIDNQRASTRRAELDARKVESDMAQAEHHRKAGDRKDYITTLAPVFTTVVLAGTLILQSYQFVRQEQDKQAEARRQADAAEDARWGDALRTLSQSDKLSPSAVVLKGFAGSAKYGPLARQSGVQLLLRTDDSTVFRDVFVSIFEPLNWDNLPQVLEIDRILYSQYDALLLKALGYPKELSFDINRLDKDETVRYQRVGAELDFILSKMVPVLKGPPRPKGMPLDLQNVGLVNGDLQGTDLSGANITHANFSNANLKGANLSGITEFINSQFSGSSWWEAAQMSPELLEHLTKEFSPKSTNIYVNGPVTEQHYQAQLARLQQH
jgi:hypothetical protein